MVSGSAMEHDWVFLEQEISFGSLQHHLLNGRAENDSYRLLLHLQHHYVLGFVSVSVLLERRSSLRLLGLQVRQREPGQLESRNRDLRETCYVRTITIKCFYNG